MIRLIALTAAWVLVFPSVAYGSFCDSLSPEKGSQTWSYELIKGVCSQTDPGGVTVRLKEGFLVFPKPFFVSVSGDSFVRLSSALLVEETWLESWNIGAIEVGRLKDQTTAEIGDEIQISHSVIEWAEEICGFPFQLTVRRASGSTDRLGRDEYILQIGDDYVKARGNVECFFLALAEMFGRSNCT